jgi:glycosyltransferase involved in cell wall biosynthesis
MRRNVAFISVVPSPYQRDLFLALSQRPEINLRVYYLEAASPDSPWPQKPQAAHEEIMQGSWVALGHARFHFNWPLPDLRAYDDVVLNIPVNAFTGQWLMRCILRSRPWIFWGEMLRKRDGGPCRMLHDGIIRPLRRATAIVGVGTRAMEDYRARFPGTRHFSIPYHCDLRPFMDARRRACNADEIVFLFCGQMIARKGVDLLMTAFEQVAAKYRNARLLLVGREAELPRLLAGVSRATQSRINYAGFHPPEELPGFFAQSDVFVLPSRYDGWGVVVNQALGAGLPVVCSDAAGAGFDLVVEEINGLKFEAGNAGVLADKLERFTREPGLSVKFGVESKRMAWDWLPEKGAEKWIQIFQNNIVR